MHGKTSPEREAEQETLCKIASLAIYTHFFFCEEDHPPKTQENGPLWIAYQEFLRLSVSVIDY